MNIKNLIIKNKIIAICFSIALGLGIISGTGEMPKEEYKSLVEQNEQLDNEIVFLDKELEEAQNEVNTLQAKKDERDRIAKAEADRIAKEEADRKAKEEAEAKARAEAEAKAEAERIAQEEAERLAQEEANRIAQEQQNSNNYVASGNGESNVAVETPVGQMVWLSATGDKYHAINNCGRMNPDKARQVTVDSAISQGFGPCSKCY